MFSGSLPKYATRWLTRGSSIRIANRSATGIPRQQPPRDVGDHRIALGLQEELVKQALILLGLDDRSGLLRECQRRVVVHDPIAAGEQHEGGRLQTTGA